MINCGGLGNITECFTLTPEAKVYIIDSHRPLNLENMLEGNTQVCVFDDQDETEKINEVMKAYDAVMVKFCIFYIILLMKRNLFFIIV
jgi:cell division control protein 45